LENDSKPRKMGTFATFMAVIKAYMIINIFLLPKSFVNGGYLVGIFMHIFAAIIEGTSAALLC
jgi:hypothetical protein